MRFVESTLSAHAVGGNAVERFFLGTGEERVDAVGSEASFEAIGAFDGAGGV